MLWNASVLNGYAIAASNGYLGTVGDFLFDDVSWSVRWLVVDTGKRRYGRKVLLPSTVLGDLDPNAREFSVRLTRQQVLDSPDVDTDLPVSRQMEANIYDRYGWSAHRGAALDMDECEDAGATIEAPPRPAFERRAAGAADASSTVRDPHLRSVEAITRSIHGGDEIGRIEGFLVEDGDWSIHIVRRWMPAKRSIAQKQEMVRQLIPFSHALQW